MDSKIYTLKTASQAENSFPIIISAPHAGEKFPSGLLPKRQTSYESHCPDTDWYIDRVFDFAMDFNASILAAVYNRYVIDLNRGLDAKPLYDDGRYTSELVPLKSFALEPIYSGPEPSKEEIRERIETFYQPYHEKLRSIIAHLHASHGKVLLIEAHSIRRHVPALMQSPITDIVIGTDSGRTASEKVNERTIDTHSLPHSIEWNKPFRGGYNTRFYASPQKKIFSLQFEIAQDCYLEDPEIALHGKSPLIDKAKLSALQSSLKNIIEQVISNLDMQ